jgi:hypothetical protein
LGEALVPVELGGLVEVRIHGVSGTAATSMLETSDTMLVAGDAVSGFHRRRAWTGYGPAEAGKELTSEGRPLRRHLEAYTWGGLTSGAASRALWLLLLPFTFVNVAAWGHPSAGLDRRTPWRNRRIKALLATLRLLGLTLTVLLLLAASGVAQDVIGWQCGSRPECFADRDLRGGGLLELLGRQQPGVRLAVAALLPLLALAVLWVLGSATWKSYDQTQMPESQVAVDSDEAIWHTYVQSPFADRRFWSCRNSIARLRSLHIAAGVCAVLLVTALPALLGRETSARWLIAGPLAAITVGSLLLACVPPVTDVTNEIDLADDSPLNGAPKVLRTAALLMVPVVLVYVWRVPADSFRTDVRLPGYDVVVALTVALQVLLLAVLVALSWPGRVTTTETPEDLEADWPREGTATRQDEVQLPPFCRGFATPVFATIGCFLALVFTAGVAYGVAAAVGTPASRPGEAEAQRLGLVASRLYDWVATSYVFMVALLVLGLLVVLVRTMGVRIDRTGGGFRPRFGLSAKVLERHQAEVGTDYGLTGAAGDAADRVRQISTTRWLAGVTDSAHYAVAALGILGGLVIVASIVLTGLTNEWISVDVLGTGRARRWLSAEARLDTIRRLAPVGTSLVVATMAGLVGAGLAAYRSDATRRSVGILWDLATFWPRGAHPLAPPCYSDRTVPQLSARIAANVEADGRVLVSAHSQGTVITHATLLGLDQRTLDGVAWLTHGSPLARLYSRGFPAYFGRWSMEAMRERLTTDGEPPRWINLWRKTDYLGRWIGQERHAVNRYVVEPAFAPSVGDVLLPVAQMHSNYYSEPAYDAAVVELENRLGLATAQPPAYPFMSGGE